MTSDRGIPTWLFVKERETQQWVCIERIRGKTEKYYPSINSRRQKTRTYYPGYVYPKPEHVSPFIEAHCIIRAQTQEEAWQKLRFN